MKKLLENELLGTQVKFDKKLKKYSMNQVSGESTSQIKKSNDIALTNSLDTSQKNRSQKNVENESTYIEVCDFVSVWDYSSYILFLRYLK